MRDVLIQLPLTGRQNAPLDSAQKRDGEMWQRANSMLPNLDWPVDLFSRSGAGVDGKTSYR